MTPPIAFIFTALLLESAQAESPLNVEGRFNADVHFERTATTPSASELQRFTDTINRVRKSEFCPLEVVIAVGHAEASEGNQQETQELSMKRAQYIDHILKAEGIPSSAIMVEHKGATQPIVSAPDQRNARVELEFIGSAYPSSPCTIPVGAKGFRLRTP
ncbi:OmpA family protein [Collimonas humicola]|uniref:OmpA family protein n=1 Tax=Collimonas humicola TaxID=2825886 RepID=UPI001B8AC1A1|nr:OmpA family protein [Collimonas humicola]